MNNKLNRKSDDESNKMLRSDPSLIFKKTIKTLEKKYGYSDKQIGSHFVIPQDFENFVVDLAVFSKEDDKNPKIIGEIKVGNFVFPFAEYQLEKYMKITNTKYGFLTNGTEWINYELLDKKIIRISDIPTLKELKQIISGQKILKEYVPLIGADYILRKILRYIFSEGGNDDIFLQLIAFKLYDEIFNKNRNFKKIVNFPETHLEVFDKLWKNTNEEFPHLFSENYLKRTSPNILSVIIEFANFSLTKSDPVEISKFIVENHLFSGPRSGFSGVPKELIQFFFNLLELSEKDKIVIPYSGPEILVHILGLLHSKFPKSTKENIVTIEQNYNKTRLLRVISLLKLPKFRILSHDPISTSISEEFRKFGHVISIPPFGAHLNRNEFENTLGDYGNEQIRYFIKRLISSFQTGTKISVVVPQGFLFNQTPYGKKIRNEILETCTIHGIIQLPNTTFKFSTIETSLLLLEIGNSKKSDYNIFMSVLPKSSKTISKFNEDIIKRIIGAYHNFEKKNSVKDQDQNAFVVSINEILENGWTVTDKIPEIKQMLDIPYKERISDVVEIIQGTNTPREITSIGKRFHFIRISDIENGFIKSNVSKTISLDENFIPKYKKYFIKRGDVLLSSKGTIGKSALVNPDYEGSIASNQLFILRTNQKKILPEYLIQVLNSQLVKKQINGIVRGVSIPFLSRSGLEKIVISVPTIDKQKKVVSEFLKLQKEIFDLEQILAKKRRNQKDLVGNE